MAKKQLTIREELIGARMTKGGRRYTITPGQEKLYEVVGLDVFESKEKENATDQKGNGRAVGPDVDGISHIK